MTRQISVRSETDDDDDDDDEMLDSTHQASKYTLTQLPRYSYVI